MGTWPAITFDVGDEEAKARTRQSMKRRPYETGANSASQRRLLKKQAVHADPAGLDPLEKWFRDENARLTT